MTTLPGEIEISTVQEIFSSVIASLEGFEDKSASQKTEVAEKSKDLADHHVDYLLVSPM